jgi:hypothetical protein
MTLCALDPEYPIQVDAKDSPLFHDLVQHWGGDSETVVNVEQHYYEEIISMQVTRRHVVTLRAEQIDMNYQLHGPDTHSPIDHAYVAAPPVLQGEVSIPLWDDKRIDDTMTNWDSWFKEEQTKKVYWRKTRLFFKMVWVAYKTARESS